MRFKNSISFFASLFLLAFIEARADQRFYIAPDHFEIETINSVLSYKVKKNSLGVLASIHFVPGYDVALSTLQYHHRESAEEIEVIKLPIEVVEFKFGNPALENSPAVETVESEIWGHQVRLTIQFSKDIDEKQADKYLKTTAVYGTVSAKFREANNLPQSVRNKGFIEVPTFNQYHTNVDGSGSHLVDFSTYSTLSRYKTETEMAHAGRISNVRDLDQFAQKELMNLPPGAQPECLPSLSGDETAVCKIILSNSPSGVLSEALFSLAKRVFPQKLVEDDYRRFVFVSENNPSKPDDKKNGNPPDESKQSQFENYIAKQAVLNRSAREEKLREYVLQFFDYPRTYEDHKSKVDAMVENLLKIRSLSEDNPMTRALLNVYLDGVDNQKGHVEFVADFLSVLETGKDPGSSLFELFNKRQALRISTGDFYELFRDWEKRNAPTVYLDPQLKGMRLASMTTPMDDPKFVKENLIRLFRRVEAAREVYCEATKIKRIAEKIESITAELFLPGYTSPIDRLYPLDDWKPERGGIPHYKFDEKFFRPEKDPYCGTRPRRNPTVRYIESATSPFIDVIPSSQWKVQYETMKALKAIEDVIATPPKVPHTELLEVIVPPSPRHGHRPPIWK